ncbi:NUT family member 2G isoform X1 [Camelus ferus]|uniref:NUT family member 2G isoform X1 n=2 Tax=Camelus ferus TaxID=419612 RepID=A0A8B8STM8_CAMFR|nr:NUT family member 2G isoform X1 [Camelus ferus]
MALQRASPLLGTDVLMSTGASVSPFTALPFPPPAPGPQHRPPWEQHLPPSLTPSFPPGTTLLLPAFPTTPLVATGGQVPTATGPCNIPVYARSEGRPTEFPPMQSFVLPPGTVTWGAPGALSGTATCPAPLSSAPQVTTPAVGVTQAGTGGWAPGRPSQAPPPPVQLAPSVAPINTGPRPPGASREGSLAPSQSQPPQDDSFSCNDIYKHYRRWQRFKSLARRHLPQSPDAQALFCFVIPVLRSLARLKPTMTLEEGLRRAEQQWERTSNFDRMNYYEMAAKFKEIEAEDEMQPQHLQCTKGVQGLPPPAPPKLEPWGPPAPKVGPQPGTHVPTGAEHKACVPRKASPTAKTNHPQPDRSRQPPETKEPKEIPLEALSEYEDILEELLGPVLSATWEPEAACPEDGTYPDPGLLSYMDQLCSQEDFVTKVEDIIHPQFLEDLLSPESQLDPLALAEELEQEEGLTLEELVQKPLLTLNEELGESDVTQDAQRHDHGPQLGVSDEESPPETEFKQLATSSGTDSGLLRPKLYIHSPGHEAFPTSQAGQPLSPPQGQRHTAPSLGPRDTSTVRETSPLREDAGPGPGPGDGSRENKEEVPSLDFILATQYCLMPWGGKSHSSAPGPLRFLCPGVQGARQGPSPQRIGPSAAPPPAAKPRKRDLCGGQGSDDKLPQPKPDLGLSGTPALPPGLVRPSQPKMRRCDPFVGGSGRRRRKRHCNK